jgi:hypothetical protein
MTLITRTYNIIYDKTEGTAGKDIPEKVCYKAWDTKH